MRKIGSALLLAFAVVAVGSGYFAVLDFDRIKNGPISVKFGIVNLAGPSGPCPGWTSFDPSEFLLKGIPLDRTMPPT